MYRDRLSELVLISLLLKLCRTFSSFSLLFNYFTSEVHRLSLLFIDGQVCWWMDVRLKLGEEGILSD